MLFDNWWILPSKVKYHAVMGYTAVVKYHAVVRYTALVKFAMALYAEVMCIVILSC